jgi:hypothetical protein
MGTRSTIALEFADGTVQQVYCHWDGYLSNNGRILQEHYSDPFKLRDLIDLGDISSLRPTVGTKHAFSQFETEMSSEDYDKLYGEMTTFYGRDRGEKNTEAKKFVDFDNYVRCHAYEEYEYILRNIDGKAVWFVADHSDVYVPLLAAMANQAVEETEDTD